MTLSELLTSATARRQLLLLAVAGMLCASCSNGKKDYDATGCFEATEVTVSAEQNGTLLQFNVNEGDTVDKAVQVGLIDTTQLYLKAHQIGAIKLVYASQKPETEKQIAALRQQLKKAKDERNRYALLVKDGAANSKLLDDATSQVEVLQRQLDAQLSTLHTSTNSLNAQIGTANAEQLQVADQLRKCHIVTPISGTVIEKYAECGEWASVGKPLFKMADVRHMFLRAYITSAQLKDVKLGQNVKVIADYGNGQTHEYAGRVSWISSKSEFTPKTILTDDERANLVYAVKVAVENGDGLIKIGMYGEVKL